MVQLRVKAKAPEGYISQFQEELPRLYRALRDLESGKLLRAGSVSSRNRLDWMFSVLVSDSEIDGFSLALFGAVHSWRRRFALLHGADPAVAFARKEVRGCENG